MAPALLTIDELLADLCGIVADLLALLVSLALCGVEGVA